MRLDNFEVEVEHDDISLLEFAEKKATTYGWSRRKDRPWTVSCWIVGFARERFKVYWRYCGGRPESWGSTGLWSASYYNAEIHVDGRWMGESHLNTTFMKPLPETRWRSFKGSLGEESTVRFRDHANHYLETSRSKAVDQERGTIVITFTPHTSAGKPSKGANVLRFVYMYRDKETLDQLGVIPPPQPVEAANEDDSEQAENKEKEDEDADKNVVGEDLEHDPAAEQVQEEVHREEEQAQVQENQDDLQVDDEQDRTLVEDVEEEGGHGGDDESFSRALKVRLVKLRADRQALDKQIASIEELMVVSRAAVAETKRARDNEKTTGDEGDDLGRPAKQRRLMITAPSSAQ